ncbi:MazG nucleotide pyrophosphohydrolase family protein [Frankia torreyi]|uniref:MazG nucleotide pyrophosphohydrolase family protein n=1 Tax=Frankia torreyi TaxID=1856 RepID=A0A0D8B503_9ACTN|nr:nucleoside triphosphate pyrophosphohydrolase family protein [Frankia torreyi]KJE19363.1 MazG nucleotide pyrophosphohydrolase family protein [Frankia torreyi]
MKLSDYQAKASRTVQRPGQELPDLAVHLLGLVGETGSIASEYKKLLRDGPAHLTAKSRLREELGDVLWYLATLATKLDLDLDDIATANLTKVTDRWRTSATADLFDEDCPTTEQLPRHARFTFATDRDQQTVTTRLLLEGEQVGNTLTDASHVDDGYRFHDVFHLAHAALLGWSPVLRKLLGRKRRSKPLIDVAEDGGRAIVAEEGVAHMVFAYAASHDYLRDIQRVDTVLLDLIRSSVGQLEVSVRRSADWEQAILAGYTAWNYLRDHDGGSVLIDLLDRKIIAE